MSKKQIPNLITVSRLAVVPFGLYVHSVLSAGRIPGWAAWAVLVLLIWGDYLDGILARRWQAESDFGRFVDPMVDKTFLLTMLLVYGLAAGSPGLWMLIAIRLTSDLLTFGLSLLSAARSNIKGAAFIGKRKTDIDFIALLIGYTPLLLLGYPSFTSQFTLVLIVSTVLGYMAFGYYLARFLGDRSPLKS